MMTLLGADEEVRIEKLCVCQGADTQECEERHRLLLTLTNIKTNTNSSKETISRGLRIHDQFRKNK